MILRLKNMSKTFRVYQRPRFWLYEKISLGAKQYRKEVAALKGLSLELGKGQCLGIIGKNGAGKSTLLRIVAGISPPSSGEIEIVGRVASLLELGSGFHPEFTGRENLLLNGMIAGFSRSELEKKIREIILFSELGEFIEFPVRTYSDGMYLRLGFSLAQALDPELLLIDEALAVGDEYFRSKCLRRMLEFKEQGAAMMIASHDLTMVRGLCDRVAYLSQGKLQKIGPAGEVIESYLEEIYQEAVSGEMKAPAHGEWKRRGSGEATIISARIKNSEGKETALIRPGERMEIEYEYRAEREVKEPLFGVNIFRTDGVLILSANQECAQGAGEEFGQGVECGFSGPIPPGHRGSVRYQFRNLLLAGRYQVSVNIFKGRSGACLPVDEVFDLIRFEVGPGKILDRGVFINPCDWRIS